MAAVRRPGRRRGCRGTCCVESTRAPAVGSPAMQQRAAEVDAVGEEALVADLEQLGHDFHDRADLALARPRARPPRAATPATAACRSARRSRSRRACPSARSRSRCGRAAGERLRVCARRRAQAAPAPAVTARSPRPGATAPAPAAAPRRGRAAARCRARRAARPAAASARPGRSAPRRRRARREQRRRVPRGRPRRCGRLRGGGGADALRGHALPALAGRDRAAGRKQRERSRGNVASKAARRPDVRARVERASGRASRPAARVARSWYSTTPSDASRPSVTPSPISSRSQPPPEQVDAAVEVHVAPDARAERAQAGVARARCPRAGAHGMLRAACTHDPVPHVERAQVGVTARPVAARRAALWRPRSAAARPAATPARRRTPAPAAAGAAARSPAPGRARAATPNTIA